MKKTIFYFLLVSFSSILISTGCQREVEGSLTNPPQPPVAENVNANVVGRIIDEKNDPVSGAVVSTVNGSSATTNINGEFNLQNVLLNKNAGFITVEKAGYFKGARTFVVSTTSDNITEIQLIPKASAGSFVASAGGNIVIPNGGTLVFPTNGIVNASNNSSYTGNVSVAAYFLNPEANNFADIMPGTLRGTRTNNSEVVLQSYGMVAVELTGSGGEKLQMATGKTAAINLPIASSLLSSAPASIPLWYFDETKGLWKEEGSAAKQGSSYVGTVSHFSFWNCDVPFPLVDFEATFKDQNGQPISKAKVVITTGGKTSISASDITNSDGRVAGKIPANSQLLMEVTNDCGEMIYSKNLTTTTSDLNLGNITVTIGSAAYVILSGTVSGCNGTTVTNGFVHIAVGNITYRAPITNGNFSASVTMCSAGNYSAVVQAFDLANNRQSDSTILAVNTTSPSTLQLNTCQATIDQFVNYTVNGSTFSLIAPVDSLNYSSQNSGDALYAVSKSNGNKVSMFLQSVTATGQKSLQFIGLNLRDTTFFGENISTVNITEYNPTATGIYIAGTLSGTIKADSTIGNVVYPLNLSFRVKK